MEPSEKIWLVKLTMAPIWMRNYRWNYVDIMSPHWIDLFMYVCIYLFIYLFMRW